MSVSELTMAELRYRHALLVRQAAEVRGRWRDMPTGPGALATGKRLRVLERRAEDYRKIIGVIEDMDLDQVLEALRD